MRRIERLMRIAERREGLHKNHASSRPLSEGYELVGVVGEEAFESAFGYPIDEEDRPGGDGNVDFNTPVGTVDVKTARKPYHLLVEVGKPQADIIVLAEYLPDIKMAVLIGWEYSEYVQRTPVKRFHKDGPQNHYIRAEYLRPMKELDALIRDVGKNSIKAK